MTWRLWGDLVTYLATFMCLLASMITLSMKIDGRNLSWVNASVPLLMLIVGATFKLVVWSIATAYRLKSINAVVRACTMAYIGLCTAGISIQIALFLYEGNIKHGKTVAIWGVTLSVGIFLHVLLFALREMWRIVGTSAFEDELASRYMLWITYTGHTCIGTGILMFSQNFASKTLSDDLRWTEVVAPLVLGLVAHCASTTLWSLAFFYLPPGALSPTATRARLFALSMRETIIIGASASFISQCAHLTDKEPLTGAQVIGPLIPVAVIAFVYICRTVKIIRAQRILALNRLNTSGQLGGVNVDNVITNFAARQSTFPTAMALDADADGDNTDTVSESTMSTSSHHDDTRCAVCMHKSISTVLVPCGHMGTCNKCAKQLIRQKQKCPFCRKRVDRDVRVYFPQANLRVLAQCIKLQDATNYPNEEPLSEHIPADRTSPTTSVDSSHFEQQSGFADRTHSEPLECLEDNLQVTLMLSRCGDDLRSDLEGSEVMATNATSMDDGTVSAQSSSSCGRHLPAAIVTPPLTPSHSSSPLRTFIVNVAPAQLPKPPSPLAKNGATDRSWIRSASITEQSTCSSNTREHRHSIPDARTADTAVQKSPAYRQTTTPSPRPNFGVGKSLRALISHSTTRSHSHSHIPDELHDDETEEPRVRSSALLLFQADSKHGEDTNKEENDELATSLLRTEQSNDDDISENGDANDDAETPPVLPFRSLYPPQVDDADDALQK